MQATTSVLRQIGHGLDSDRFPAVFDGGFVVPGDHAISLADSGTESADERQRERGPSAGSREGATGRQGATDGPRAASPAASTVVDVVEQTFLDQLADIECAYPRLRVWRRPGGIWMSIHAGLVYGSPTTAHFIVAVPFTGRMPKAWAFWTDGTWIGPRHTNFGDGSICCLHLPDRTWTIDDPLISLLDLYTLWAVRHLYMAAFGRWPGRQVATLRFERLTEILDDELCGCGSATRYRDCCKAQDSKLSRLSASIEFAIHAQERTVPVSIWKFLNGESDAPSFDQLIFY
jgi:hypothetical protein